MATTLLPGEELLSPEFNLLGGRLCERLSLEMGSVNLGTVADVGQCMLALQSGDRFPDDIRKVFEAIKNAAEKIDCTANVIEDHIHGDQATIFFTIKTGAYSPIDHKVFLQEVITILSNP